MLVDCCSLSGVCCLLCVGLLFDARCSLFAVCCLLRAVWLLLIVGR